MTKVLDIALADGRFYTLVDALRATGLDTTLAQSTPYTLFAPTDDAFAGFAPGGLAALTGDLAGLTRLLRKHVVPGAWLSTQLATVLSVTTFDQQPLGVSVDEDRLAVDGVRLIMRDIEGDDGVMHVLDRVLTPPPAP
ncbi:MAG: fasciclin domain-containing protein [Anaerolineae bacterium]|nr:fasciclin domain-containing protein [Anaerolineae bacterium]